MTTATPSVGQSPGGRFRQALVDHHPLAIVGTINPYCAMMAERVGHQVIYLAGGGLATYSHGMPDLAMTTINDVLDGVRRLTDACQLPLLVDVDTGFGGVLSIRRLVKGLIKDGAAALHIEDQVALKRCGHRPGKKIVSTVEMCDRLKACVDARTDPQFVVVARTDALANEGLPASIERAQRYMEAGADMIFAEACATLEEYRAFAQALPPRSLLANLTEFSLTPAFPMSDLGQAGVAAVLFPLSAARAMAAAALNVYQAILRDGTPNSLLHTMQPRTELYEFLDYERYERIYDRFASPGGEGGPS